jgi:nucleoid-associated protein YgaU
MVDVVLGAALVTSTVTNGSARAAGSHHSGWSTVIAPHLAAVRTQDAAISNGSDGAARNRKAPETTDRPTRSPLPHSIRSYVVRPGDSLWSIAEAKLDGSYRWTEIWKLNQGREVGDGEHVLDRCPGT